MQITLDIRDELGLDYFDGARNTPKLGFVRRKLSGLCTNGHSQSRQKVRPVVGESRPPGKRDYTTR